MQSATALAQSAEPASRVTPETRVEVSRTQATARLRRGTPVRVRECTTDDERGLREFLGGLCLEARRLRFFTGGVDVASSAQSGVLSGPGRLGLLAFDEHERIIGHAVCIELRAGCAELALEVADSVHGEGLGTILVERLAELAEHEGITTLVAEVLPENHAMLEVFRDGFDAKACWRGGVEHVEFAAGDWRLARERYGE